jgi:hypothetical protein
MENWTNSFENQNLTNLKDNKELKEYSKPLYNKELSDEKILNFLDNVIAEFKITDLNDNKEVGELKEKILLGFEPLLNQVFDGITLNNDQITQVKEMILLWFQWAEKSDWKANVDAFRNLVQALEEYKNQIERS